MMATGGVTADGDAWRSVDAIPPLTEDEMWRLARTEYARMHAMLRSLDAADWARPTDCPAWTVRQMLGHLVGAAEGFANPLELLHQYSAGRRLIREGRTDGRQPVDGANAVQVAERADATTAELIDRYGAVVEPVMRWRRRLRHLPLRVEDAGGRLTLRQLFEVILTRDTWMHRVDITRSTNRPFELTPEHDGRIVADAVRDWAGKHGQPFSLRLTGPAGGRYRSGEGDAAEVIELDAVEFLRVLSGRAAGTGLLATRIVF